LNGLAIWPDAAQGHVVELFRPLMSGPSMYHDTTGDHTVIKAAPKEPFRAAATPRPDADGGV
jgi:hypothetical protein